MKLYLSKLCLYPDTEMSIVSEADLHGLILLIEGGGVCVIQNVIPEYV